MILSGLLLSLSLPPLPAAALTYTGGGDSDGVGHFRSKNNTGVIQRNMITGACTGTGCCSGYGFSCVN